MVALWFTGLLANLPTPTLGAIVLVAVSGMFKVDAMRRMWRLSRRDLLFASAAMLGVLVFDTLPGLIGAVLLSLGAVVWSAASPSLATLGRVSGTGAFVDVGEHPDAREVDGLLLLSIEENLFFANSVGIRESIRERAASSRPPVQVVVLDIGAVVDIDLPACDQLRGLAEDLGGRGIRLALTRVRRNTRPVLERTGVIDSIGTSHVFASNLAAVAAFARSAGQGPHADELLEELRAGLIELRELSPSNEVTRVLTGVLDYIDRSEPGDGGGAPGGDAAH